MLLHGNFPLFLVKQLIIYNAANEEAGYPTISYGRIIGERETERVFKTCL